MTKVSIITPWHNCPELIPDYRDATQKADELIIIDNASNEETASALVDMLTLHPNGKYLRNETNVKYARANNQGLDATTGDIVVFLNSDIAGNPNWIDAVRAFVKPGALYGPSMGNGYVDGVHIPYLEGWCIAGHLVDFARIGGWNDIDFPGLYYEDNELCWRATRAGLSLKVINLPLRHLSNYTSKHTPGAYDHSGANRNVFKEIVRRDRNGDA